MTYETNLIFFFSNSSVFNLCVSTKEMGEFLSKVQYPFEKRLSSCSGQLSLNIFLPANWHEIHREDIYPPRINYPQQSEQASWKQDQLGATWTECSTFVVGSTGSSFI